MRMPEIAGIASIECPSCGHTLHDFDRPESIKGVNRLRARCHECLTEQVLAVDSWRGETSVSPISHVPWAKPA